MLGLKICLVLMLMSKARTDFRGLDFVTKSCWNGNVYVVTFMFVFKANHEVRDRGGDVQNMLGFNANLEGTDRFQGSRNVMKSYWNCNVYVCYQSVSWRQGLDLYAECLHRLLNITVLEDSATKSGLKICNEIILKSSCVVVICFFRLLEGGK